MSVEYCVVRLTPAQFEQLQQKPASLTELMESYYAKLLDKDAEKDCVDARAVYRGQPIQPPTLPLRMLHIDEFTTSLLVSFMENEETPILDALVGWDKARLLAGLKHGHGNVLYYPPSDVTDVSARLESHPNLHLESRFLSQAEDFRAASAGYFQDDAAILAHQQTFAELLRQFYREAAQAGDYVLLLTV